MNKVEMLTKMNRKINRLKMKGRKYSPEILLILGLAGVVTSTVLACVATTKVPTVRAKKEDALDDMHARLDQDPDDITQETHLAEIKKETTAIYLKTGVGYLGLYAPAVVVGGLSLSMLVMSNVILRKRLIGVSAAYATISASFKEYRSRVETRYGADVEKEIRYNIQPKEITTTVLDAKGKEKDKKETVKVMMDNGPCDFARIWGPGCPGCSKDPFNNLTYLKCQESAANKKLKGQGYLFINEVYSMLGFPKIKEGQVAGWIYDPENPNIDNKVDFGIFDVKKEGSADFVNGYSMSTVLDFNIDGNIIDLI